MEEINVPKFLEKFNQEYQKLNPIQRIILAADGTVATLLSVIFKKEVEVKVISQYIEEGDISRFVHLVCDGKIVAYANTTIPIKKNKKEIIDDILEKKEGLGLIAKKHGIFTERKILRIYADKYNFSRNYSIIGDGVHFDILETFPSEIYRNL